MGTLTTANPSSKEYLTEILDKDQWWNILKLLVRFLRSKGVEQVQLEFGFVLDRDLKGDPQTKNQVVQLSDLERSIKQGLDAGTIEWAGGSDFVFKALGSDLVFMLCNDADLHFASPDSPLLVELGRQIRATGIKVYDSGKLI